MSFIFSSFLINKIWIYRIEDFISKNVNPPKQIYFQIY